MYVHVTSVWDFKDGEEQRILVDISYLVLELDGGRKGSYKAKKGLGKKHLFII